MVRFIKSASAQINNGMPEQNIVYFKKIEFKLDVDVEKIKSSKLKETYEERFISYEIADMQYFNDALSRAVKFNIPPHSTNYTEILKIGTAKHSDGPSIVVMNYYLETDNDVTIFWKPLSKDGDPYDVRYADCFIAKSKEAFLLNASHVHSVLKKDHDRVRRFIRFFWHDIPFDEVFNSIEVIGS